MANFIYITGVLSLIVQILTGIFDYYVLRLRVPHSLMLLKKLLLLEFVVQIIEGSFYVWMVYNFSKIADITHFRYYDWFITTPTMLFTYSFYLLYLKYKEENKEINDNMYQLILENLQILVPVVILNATMLLFGYLGEIKKMSKYLAAFLGFIPFIIMFYIIYKNYAVFSKDGIQTFWYFCGIWSLYGVASIMPYSIKNIAYNILDLFSKNFFGIFLAFVLFYSNRELMKQETNAQ
jgi:bacteriorhodopsin